MYEVHTISFKSFFVGALSLIVHTWNSSLYFEVISSGCNALVVPFQQLPEGPIEVLLYDLRHSLFYLLNCLITTASELKELAKVTESKVWTIGRLRNCLDAHLGKISWQGWSCGLVHCQKEMPLTRFDECWPLPKKSLPELPLKLNIVTLTLTLNLLPINSGLLTSLLLAHLSSYLTDSLPFLNLLCHSKTDDRFMQDGRKAVWSIPYVSVAFFPSSKQNLIAYRSSKVSSRPDCIFEINHQWQSGFSRVYSNCCFSCWFEAEIIKIGLSSYKMHSNKILNFEESTTILNAHTKKILETYRMHHSKACKQMTDV